MGDVVPLFRRMPSASADAIAGAGAEIAVAPAVVGQAPTDADRAQAELFAELLAEHRSRITLALAEGLSDDPGRTRLDRAALRQELREVSAHLETIERRST